MKKRPLWVIGFLFATLLTLLVCAEGSAATQADSQAQEDFGIVTQHAIYRPASGKVTFILVFNRRPDFFTTDEFGRPANSFQYFIVGDESLPFPENFDSIIRGDEIHANSGLIPIRDAFPPDDNDPHSGGWGTVRGEVSFRTHGRVLMFSVPLDLMSDQSGATHVQYHLETYQFGDLIDSVDGSIRIQRAAVFA
jgi:hypothetical protein